MSMKVVKLYLHCTPAETMSILEFFDQLREALIDQYGDDIQQMMRDELEQRSNQLTLPFDDPIDF